MLVFFTSCEKQTPGNEMVGKQLVKSLGDFDKTLESQVTEEQLIKNLGDFDKAINLNNEVLRKMTSKSLHLFREGLIFNEQGELAGARFYEARKELSKEDYLRLWFLFDVDKEEIKTLVKEQDYAEEYKTDYKYYRCKSLNNCIWNPFHICLSGCSS